MAESTDNAQDFSNIKKLHEALSEGSDQPVEMHIQEFRKYAPLFQSTSDITDERRAELTNEYLPRVQWGYRPLTVVAEHKGEIVTVLRLPRLFVNANTPTDPKYSHLSAVNAVTNYGVDRADIRAKAFVDYALRFLNSQDDDKLIEALAAASTETEEILVQFAEATTGLTKKEIVEGPVPERLNRNGDDWSFEE